MCQTLLAKQKKVETLIRLILWERHTDSTVFAWEQVSYLGSCLPIFNIQLHSKYDYELLKFALQVDFIIPQNAITSRLINRAHPEQTALQVAV